MALRIERGRFPPFPFLLSHTTRAPTLLEIIRDGVCNAGCTVLTSIFSAGRVGGCCTTPAGTFTNLETR